MTDMPHYTLQAATPHLFTSREDVDALRRVVRAGNLQEVHNTFSDWLEDDHTNILKIPTLCRCVGDAVESDHHEILFYLLSKGIPFDILDLCCAITRKERRALEIFIAHGWNINTPRTYGDPPLLRYVAGCH